MWIGYVVFSTPTKSRHRLSHVKRCVGLLPSTGVDRVPGLPISWRKIRECSRWRLGRFKLTPAGVRLVASS